MSIFGRGIEAIFGVSVIDSRQLADLTARVDALRGELAVANSALSVSKVELDIAARVIAQRNGIRADLEHELAELKSSYSGLLTEIDLLKSEKPGIAELEFSNATLIEELNSLKTETGIYQRMPALPLARERLSILGALLRPKCAIGVDKIRVGGDADGGYVCLNDFDGLQAAVSVGIGGDVSWDLDIAEREIDIHQYDHTVTGPPAQHVRFKFMPIKLSPQDTPNSVSLSRIVKGLNVNGPASIIAKIDIEGDEWDVLSQVTSETLSCFSQVVCEYHWFEKVLIDEYFEVAVKALQNMLDVFEPIHVHANNYSTLLVAENLTFPNVLEVTYASKDKYKYQDCRETFPDALDRPNNISKPDFYLGTFRY